MSDKTNDRSRAEEDTRWESEKRVGVKVREILDLERNRQSDSRDHDRWIRHHSVIHRRLTMAMLVAVVVGALAIVAASAKYVLGL